MKARSILQSTNNHFLKVSIIARRRESPLNLTPELVLNLS